MDVENKIKRIENEIELGDMFVDSNENSYVLTLDSKSCSLLNLKGNGHWEYYESFEKAKIRLNDHIQAKILTHLSKNQYKLVLELISDKN